jgi:hypothetical protein
MFHSLILPIPIVTTTQTSDQALKQYLFNSTDPTAAYLRSALSKVNKTASLWADAESDNVTSSSDRTLGESNCRLWKRVLIWIAQRIDDTIVSGEESVKEEATMDDFASVTAFGGRFREVLEEVLADDSGKSSSVSSAHSSSAIITS